MVQPTRIRAVFVFLGSLIVGIGGGWYARARLVPSVSRTESASSSRKVTESVPHGLQDTLIYEVGNGQLEKYNPRAFSLVLELLGRIDSERALDTLLQHIDYVPPSSYTDFLLPSGKRFRMPYYDTRLKARYYRRYRPALASLIWIGESAKDSVLELLRKRESGLAAWATEHCVTIYLKAVYGARGKDLLQKAYSSTKNSEIHKRIDKCLELYSKVDATEYETFKVGR